MTGAEETASLGGKKSVWIHAEAPSEHEIKQLCSQYRLRERLVRDALDQDEIPRVEAHDEYTYIITRFAYQKQSDDIETAPILFALNHEKLITVSLEKLPSLQDILADESDRSADHDPTHILLLILLKIDADYDRFIHDSSKQIRRLLERLGRSDVGPRSFIRFVHIEDDMNDFLGSLIPTNNALKHLVNDKSVPGFATHHDLVDTVILNNDQSIQTCETNLKSLTSIRRTYTVINGYNLDRTIKILTLASVFIAIPTMFFSMYGMNIGLPQQHHRGAFAALMALCIVTVLTAFIIGRKKRIF